MAFEYKNPAGKTYYLHQREATLRGGRKQVIFFFAGEVKEGAIDKVPDGYEVSAPARPTGLPILRKAGAAAKPAAKAAPAKASGKIATDKPAAKAPAKPAPAKAKPTAAKNTAKK